MTREDVENLSVHISYDDTYKFKDFLDADCISDLMEDMQYWDVISKESVIKYIQDNVYQDMDDYIDDSKIKIEIK